jgi:NTP pyrophosphatase (non-canonical NTP hydrolase)
MTTLSDYQVKARRSANTSLPSRERKLIAALGLAGEIGEVVDLIKKFEGHGHDFKKERLIEELGDVLWSIANIATLYEIDLDNVAVFNIDKLLKRYPDGFNTVRSEERHDKKDDE